MRNPLQFEQTQSGVTITATSISDCHIFARMFTRSDNQIHGHKRVYVLRQS